jgi:FixJ family two-component response regulator
LSERSLISIVDDDQSFGDSMRRLVKALDYSVAVFPSAAQFLASTQLAATACLVADIHMPEMTGVELYNYLVESGHAIPTILVTAYPDDRVKERMLTLGWNATFISRWWKLRRSTAFALLSRVARRVERRHEPPASEKLHISGLAVPRGRQSRKIFAVYRPECYQRREFHLKPPV